ncbi:MAG: hypothetical protein IKO36_07285 [Bacteroidaceae bacterium]|nr:hypothetical protein [Bacteroidaceae bacterium]
MTIREFLELACDDGDTVELFDISEYTEFCDTVDALLNDGETMDVIEMEIMSWDYDRDKGIICLNYDSSDY